MSKFGQNTVARAERECKTVKVLPHFLVVVNGLTVFDKPLDLLSLPEYYAVVDLKQGLLTVSGRDDNAPVALIHIKVNDKISVSVGC